MVRTRILDQLYQDKTWLDAYGRRRNLEDMPRGHRRNLLALLERQAPRLHDLAATRMMSAAGPSGEAACDAFEDAVEQHDKLIPGEWLAGLALVKRLRELEKEPARARKPAQAKVIVTEVRALY